VGSLLNRVVWLVGLWAILWPVKGAQAEASTPLKPAVQTLKEMAKPLTEARLLQPDQTGVTLTPFDLKKLAQTPTSSGQAEEEIVITGKTQVTPPPASVGTPTYSIDRVEIQKQGVNSVADTLKNLPGFVVNDAGFGADIHTGTAYRGSSINQSVFLLNGRSLNTNINTYHGNLDLNTLPVGAIEKIELSSGSSSTLYGSEAFGGVVNIITKPGGGTPKLTLGTQFGSYGQQKYQAGYTGAVGAVDYALGYEKYKADNDYDVPVGAANRDANGRLFNADVSTTSYYGRFAWHLDPRNVLTLDGTQITSNKGLIYFGFPFQRDRLDHNAVNGGLNLRSELAKGSILNTTLSFNKDYFHTYGPTANVFYRQGRLDSTGFSFRVDHDWQLTDAANLRWGVDLKNSALTAEAQSTNPSAIALNQEVSRSRFTPALFALGTFKLGKTVQAELGLRENISGEFGSSLNPSVGLKWSPTSQLALRSSWVSVRRLPGLDQQFAYDTVHGWFPNADLKPETGSSWTAGVDINPGGKISGQLTYFGSHLNDSLGTQPTLLNGRTVSKWQNIGNVDTNGLEVGLRAQLSPEWHGSLNYTYTDAKIASGADKGLQLGEIPFSVAQLGLGYDHEGWQFNVYTNYYSGSRRSLFTQSSDNPRDFSPSWVNVSLSGRVPITPGIGLLVYLENLGGQTYERTNRIYQPGTTFRLGLSAEL
jgi:vitamin B12 transporter